MFREIISPILKSNDYVYRLWYKAPAMLYTRSCKHSLVLLRMGEIIVRNMLSWLKLLIKLLLLHLIGCLYCCINNARSHKHQTKEKFSPERHLDVKNLLPIRTKENISLFFLLHSWIKNTSQGQLFLCEHLASIPHWRATLYAIFQCNPFHFFVNLRNQAHSQICSLES